MAHDESHSCFPLSAIWLVGIQEGVEFIRGVEDDLRCGNSQSATLHHSFHMEVSYPDELEAVSQLWGMGVPCMATHDAAQDVAPRGLVCCGCSVTSASYLVKHVICVGYICNIVTKLWLNWTLPSSRHSPWLLCRVRVKMLALIQQWRIRLPFWAIVIVMVIAKKKAR